MFLHDVTIAILQHSSCSYFRDQIKAGCSPRRRNKNFNNPPPETIISQPADHLLQEEQSVEEPIIQIPPFRPSPSMEEKIKLIKALVVRTLGNIRSDQKSELCCFSRPVVPIARKRWASTPNWTPCRYHLEAVHHPC